MSSATRPSSVGGRGPLPGRIARVLAAVVLAVPAAMVTGCGNTDPSGVLDPSGVVDTTTLAGTWKGSVNGPDGYSVFTTVLNADSTMWWEGETSSYCKVVGSWTVSGGQYSTTGRSCGGSIVSSVAPVNKTRLTGTWSGISGNKTGTFTIAKQP